MTKFEHQILIVEKYGKGIFGSVLPREASWKVHYVNGRQLPNWDDVLLYNYLDQKGAEGWELVSMSPHISIRTGSLPIEHLYVALKRKIE